MELIKEIGAFAGLAAFFGLALLALLSFTHGRDIRRLREWAGSAPERDSERKELTSASAAQRAEEIRRLEASRTAELQAVALREQRRQRREGELPETTRGERLGARISKQGGRSPSPAIWSRSSSSSSSSAAALPTLRCTVWAAAAMPSTPRARPRG